MKRVLLSIGVIIVLVAISTGVMMFMSSLKPEKEIKEAVNVPIFVKTESVKYGPVLSDVISQGRVASISEVVLVSEAAGKIEPGDVVLKRGASFKRGDALFSIYNDEAELMLKADKSKFMSTISTILPDIKVDYPDSYSLFENFFNKIGIDKPLPELPSIDMTARASLKVFLASRNILTEYYTIRRSELALSRYTINAPFDGTFNQVYMEIGAYANIGSQIAQMIRTDLLEIEVPVESSYAKWLSIGSEADITTSDRGKQCSGKVVRTSKFVDETTQQQSIFVQIKGSNSNLFVGEYVDVKFAEHEVDDVMEVPRGSIFNSNEMYIVKNSKLAKIVVEIVKLGEQTALVRGVDEGAELVIQPLVNVKESTTVKIIPKS